MASLASYSSLVSDPTQSTFSYGFSNSCSETCTSQLFDGDAHKHRFPLECRSVRYGKGAEFGSFTLKRRSDKGALKSRSVSLHVACVASLNGPEYPKSSSGIAPGEPATEESASAQPVSSLKTEPDDNFKLHCLTEAGGDGGEGNGTIWAGRGGGGGGGDDGDGNGGSNDGDDDDDDDNEEREFGSLLNAEEVSRQIKARNITLPMDMAEAAKTVGIRSLVLDRFMDLQASRWPLGAAIRASGMLRNRMLADRGFLFKLLTEIAIDSGCATFAEVKKRGDDFWDEFELYMADLIVGVVVDAALVGMLAPFVQFRRAAPSTGMMAHLSRSIQALPSSVFEAATPGRRFSIQQRVASYFYKGLQYGAVGFSCGIIGQGIANSIMLLKRKLKKSEKKDVPVPPLVKSAALWGVFLAVSSNTRYQIVNGLERVVEGSPVAKRLPLVAMAFTVCIRFANNTYGGMQFVDWARWSGVQ